MVEKRIRELRRRHSSHRQGCIAMGQLFEQDGIGDRCTLLTSAPILRGNLSAGQTQIPNRLKKVGGDGGRFITFATKRSNRLGGKLAHGVTHELLVL